jgi:hypothetical protein
MRLAEVIRRRIHIRDARVDVIGDVNAVVAGHVATGRQTDDGPPEKDSCPRDGTRGDEMAEEYRKLSPEELNQIVGEELPERAAMSLINANIAIPINAAVAANVLSDGAVAYADAAQTGNITQGN